MKIKKICKQCGKELKPKIYIYSGRKIIQYNKKFCSKLCFGNFKKDKIINPKYKGFCQFCNKEFLFDRHHLSREQKYCSRRCNYLDNKTNFLEAGKTYRFKKNHKPWNKGLNKKTSILISQIAEKRKGQKRPSVSKFLRRFSK